MYMKRYHVAYSAEKDINEALEDVISQIRKNAEGRQPILILFSSAVNDFELVAPKLYERFPATIVMGTSTYINFCSEGYSLHGISAIAIYDGIECSYGIISDIKSYPLRYAKEVSTAFNKIGTTENICCIEYTPAFANCEEIVQDTFRTALTGVRVPVFGSSAGAPDGSDISYVSLNGQIFDEACVFVMVRNLNGPIHIFKENLFKPTGESYKATDVDCDERAVYEFDSRPAASVVANALHVSIDQLEDELLMHPVGRVDKNEIYITEVDKVHPDGRITYFSRIYNNCYVEQLELEDMDMVWKETAMNVHDKVSNISFSLVVNCCSRSEYFIKENKFDEYNKFLNTEYGNFFGVSGYGEQMNFTHLNQTMLLVCFE